MDYLTVLLPNSGSSPKDFIFMGKDGNLHQPVENQVLKIPRHSLVQGFATEDESYEVARISNDMLMDENFMKSLLVMNSGSENLRSQLGWLHYPPHHKMAAVYLEFNYGAAVVS